MNRKLRKGGIKLIHEKLAAESPVKIFPLPASVCVPLSQHLGIPSIPVVNVNDRVKTGQLIAKSAGLISANIHSPVTGVITAVEDYPDINNVPKMTVFIQTEPDQWIENIDLSDTLNSEIKDSPEEIISRVTEAGIVGLGGATFPTHVKLSVPFGKTAETLLVNGNECEPYLTADYRLMVEKTDEIIVGIELILKALKISKAIICIEDNKPAAIEAFAGKLSGKKDISLVAMKSMYPQGSEKHLIKAVLKREVPSGKLPIDVGAVVHNVSTAFAVYEAVQKNKPLIERIVTVTGKSIPQQHNLKIRFGTRVSDILKFAGVRNDSSVNVILGGPMMGKFAESHEIPVTKGTNGLVILDTNKQISASYNCIRCSSCSRVCPMSLSPYLLYRLLGFEKIEMCADEHLLDCIECGCCSYICPSSLPLVQSFRAGKGLVNKLVNEKKKNN